MCGLLFAIVILGAACNAAKFPNSWRACKMDKIHNECVRRAIQEAVPDLVKGLPRLGVMPIDPLRFNRIAIDQKDRPVSLNLIFTDMEIRGLTKVKVDSVRNDWKTMAFNVSAPVLKAKSKYTADGRVLVLPIQGDGPCTLQLDDFTAQITIKFEDMKDSKQKTFYRVKDVGFIIDTQKLSLNLENLFNGNKQLGDQMNVFINENWREILTELKPAIEEALRQASIDLATRFFTKVPKNEITPQ